MQPAITYRRVFVLIPFKLAKTKGNINEEYALRFQQGEEEALSFFYLELHPALSLFANKYLQNRQVAEEIASEAFIKTWKMHERLDSYGAIRAYLYKVVYRDAMHSLKKEHKRIIKEQAAKSPEVSNDTPYHHVIRTETYRLIHTALKDLAPGNQQVIKMYFLEGKSSGEIAKELNLSRSTVKSHKAQGLAALRKKLLQIFLLLS